LSSKISKYEGVEITSEDLKSEKYLVTRYQTKLKYAWSSGVATGRYLAGLKRGEIWGRECDGCGRRLVPPRMYCEICFKPTSRWVKLKDTGKVVTYSVTYVNSDASRRKDPIIVAVVEIDGGSPLMGILHVLGEVEPGKVRIGMPVKAVWKPAEERKGAITDIRYFRPSRRGE
jgi:uncharacterized protein